MKRHNSILCFIILACIAATGTVHAQYWFQSGARAGNSASQNTGASVQIQTLAQQDFRSGTMAFWVGETLSNGAFLQVGYITENQSGLFPADCTVSGCSGGVSLTAGQPVWFYEYFPPEGTDTFLGSLGSANSVGTDGDINTYSFYSQGNIWFFMLNGDIIGSTDLGTPSSGPNPPIAIGELANASNSDSHMNSVTFANLSADKYGTFLPAQNAYAVLGYGVGSKIGIKNQYGIKELSNRVNYFAVGSGLPLLTNGTTLWSFGYTLHVVSKYANISGNIEYSAYSTTNIISPSVVYLNKTSRAVFSGWTGKGTGSYTGPLNSTTITLYSNITETANFQLQYYINVSSQHKTYGSGWYADGSTVNYGVSNATVYASPTSRDVFVSWSNGNAQQSGTAKALGAEQITANYVTEYLVNVTSQFGNVTGSGWYAPGSKDTISVINPIINVSTNERFAFAAWSNGSTARLMTSNIIMPISLVALFNRQYKIDLIGNDTYGNAINITLFYVSSTQLNSTPFLSPGSYAITGAYYKGVRLSANSSINITSPSTYYIPLPVYNVEIHTIDLFGIPVNASVGLSFSNKTSIQVYSGANGIVKVDDVPYGYSAGSATFGIKEHVETSNGKVVVAVFLSTMNAIIISVAAAVLAVVAYMAHLLKRKQEETPHT